MESKLGETKKERKERLATLARERAAKQQRAKDATADTDVATDVASISSSSAAGRGTVSAAADPSLLNAGLKGRKPPTTAEQAQITAKNNKKAAQQQFKGTTPPGITMRDRGNSKDPSVLTVAATATQQKEMKAASELQHEDDSLMIGIAGPLEASQVSHASASLSADSKKVTASPSAVVEEKLSSSMPQQSSEQQRQEFKVALEKALADRKKADVLSDTAPAEVPPAPPSTGEVTPNATFIRNRNEDSQTPQGVLTGAENMDEFVGTMTTHEDAAESLVSKDRKAAPGAVESDQEERGYLTREEFVGLLQQDIETSIVLTQEEYSGGKRGRVIRGSTLLILSKVLCAARKLVAKYNSPEMLSSDLSTEKPERMEELASIRMFRKNPAEDGTNILPRKRMTPLEFDQEFYNAMKDVADQARKYSEQDQIGAADDCLDDMIHLDSYSELFFDKDPLLNEGIRSLILEHYEALIVSSPKPGESKYAEVTPKEQEAAHDLVGFKRLWDFEKNIKENKELLQQATESLADSLPRLLEAGNKPTLVQKKGKNTLQLPVSLGRVQEPAAKLSHSDRSQVNYDGANFGTEETTRLMMNSSPSLINGLATRLLNDRERFSRANNFNNEQRPPSIFNANLCRVLSVGSVAVVAAALAYEWYLHSLQGSSQAAAS